MKPPFNYYGGKGTIAPAIAALLPPHRVYLEPYAGSGAVLFAKPRSDHEILNDRNGAIVAFFRVLRERPEDLVAALELSPYARDEYLSCSLDVDDDLELARRFFVRVGQAVSGIVNGNRINWSGSSKPWTNSARVYDDQVRRLSRVANRLRAVMVDNRDAIEAIRHYANTDDAVIYADPPYLAETRAAIGGYHHDADDADHHRRLADALRETPAFVVVSGYDSPLYRELFDGWDRHEIETLEKSGVVKGKAHKSRVEVLWINRTPGEGRLFA